MGQATVYEFEWGPAKALSNVRKHGISFDQARTVFLDPLALTVYDASNSLHEERWFTLGVEAGGKLLAVAHTYQIASPESSRRAKRLDANAVTMKKNRNR